MTGMRAIPPFLPLQGPEVLEAARDAAHMSKAVLLRMHEFVMDRLGIHQ
ncbi:hypothetical protein HY634_02940 [Candidatus Uhrbacteria bacterium]|nr:hypothetical protein [Candidatus Uhrbacteria bacterium]